MGCLVLLALLVLHRAKLLASNQSILALGVAPMQVVSRWCRCIVQRLCATDCKRPCLVRAAAPHSARHGRRACMPKGSMQGRIQVVEQSRCRTHRQQTTTIAETQSPQSVLIGIENLLCFSYKQACFISKAVLFLSSTAVIFKTTLPWYDDETRT